MAYVAIIIVTLFVVTNLPRILAGAHEVTNTHLIIHCIENKQVSNLEQNSSLLSIKDSSENVFSLFQSSLRSVDGLLQVGLHRPHAHGAKLFRQLRRLLLRQHAVQGRPLRTRGQRFRVRDG